MKYIIKYLLCLTALIFACSSCVKEQIAENSRPDSEKTVVMTVTTATRAGNDPAVTGIHFGDGIDNKVGKVRVLGYRVANGTLAFNETVAVGAGSDPDNGIVKGTIEVLTGRFDIVCIANEDSDASLAAVLADNDQVGTIEKLKKLSFDLSAFSETVCIPMVTYLPGVGVLGDNHIEVGGTQIKGEWDIDLERLAIRIDLTLTLTGEQGIKWDAAAADNGNKHSVTITNIPQKVFLFPSMENYNTGTKISREYEAKLISAGDPSVPGTIDIQGGNYVVEYPRIILPESYFSDKNNPEKAVVIRTAFKSAGITTTYNGKIGVVLETAAPSRNYTLPRNHYFDLDATVNDLSSTLDFTLAVKDWTTGMDLDVDALGPYTLWVEKVEVDIPIQRGKMTMKVKTDYPGEWSAVLSTDKDLSVGTTPAWLTPDWSGTITADEHTLGMTYEANPDEGRSAYLHLTAGRLTTVAKINQNGTIDFSGAVLNHLQRTYVGAFWRWNQTGERLIRIEVEAGMGGKWMALVDEDRNWIKLDANDSDDPGIEWRGGTNPADMIADDAIYQVGGNLASVSGTANVGEYIYFRIGLKNTLTSKDDDPRYGIVYLYFRNYDYYHKIYIRQGEAPDYLMRKDDPVSGSWVSATRPLAAKYSPFNLTSQEYINGGKSGGFNVTDHSQILSDRSNAAFTDYPTQVGAYFQWANDHYPRYAWHPSVPWTGTENNLTFWQTNYSSGFWNTLANDPAVPHETCPPGYRRPHDGDISANVSNPAIADSEQRQSLWLNPQSGNTSNVENALWGYCADGFFDRRKPQDVGAVSDTKSSVVSMTDHRIAYHGRLFFNPYNNASLFFPNAGYRSEYTSSSSVNGSVVSNARYMHYWTATSSTEANGRLLNSTSRTSLNHAATTKARALPIRCVREVTP